MVSYESAGVDIEAGDRAVELMSAWVAKPRPEGPAGSAGSPGSSTPARWTATAARCWLRRPTGSAPRSSSPQPCRYDTIGIDLVGMVVDDLVVCGAEPLFMTDYIVFGLVLPGAHRGQREGASRRAACTLAAR